MRIRIASMKTVPLPINSMAIPMAGEPFPDFAPIAGEPLAPMLSFPPPSWCRFARAQGSPARGGQAAASSPSNILRPCSKAPTSNCWGSRCSAPVPSAAAGLAVQAISGRHLAPCMGSRRKTRQSARLSATRWTPPRLPATKVGQTPQNSPKLKESREQ